VRFAGLLVLGSQAEVGEMSSNERSMASVYMEWAKLRSAARFNLATSGIVSYPLAALPVTMAELEINGPTVYGFEPLQERLARKCGVAAECVVAATGTSMANHLAMAAVLSPGDEVLVERPTYGLLLETVSYLGAQVLRFDRHAKDGFQIDLDDVKVKVNERTRLVILTNPHNPTGDLTDEGTLRAIGEAAAKVGAWVLVDEVYLDMVYDGSVPSSASLGDNFIVTSSLTKAYGLSGLRCGWIIAEPSLAKRIWRLNDLFGASPHHTAELLSVIALDHLDQVRERAKRLLEVNHAALDGFFADREDLEGLRPQWGTVSFPKLKRGLVDEFCELLRGKYETSVVPGRFFGMPEHFRIGIGGDTRMTAEGLKRLGDALDEYGAR
jgi:aspartate/methionine/tyrosine aminotransferase